MTTSSIGISGKNENRPLNSESSSSMPILSTISIYPIKSLRGYNLASSIVERKGLENDRRLMAIDPQGRFLTQREHARMALICPELENGILRLSAPGMNALSLEVRSQGQQIGVDIWKSSGVLSIDQGDLAAEWLSDFLKIPARLVRMADETRRMVSSEYAFHKDDHVGFADGFPILIVSQESLDDLNSRLETPLPMNRFRTNLVVRDTAAFAEDSWKRIRVGAIEMALVKPCARCNVPTINQDTAESGKEPNTTLAQYRKFNGKIMFGVNVIPISIGRIQVGQEVEILE